LIEVDEEAVEADSEGVIEEAEVVVEDLEVVEGVVVDSEIKVHQREL
jgi:hypothetical protein